MDGTGKTDYSWPFQLFGVFGNAYFSGAFSDFFHGKPLGPLGCQQSSTTTEVCCTREAGIPGVREVGRCVDESLMGDGFLTRDAPKINKNGGVIT